MRLSRSESVSVPYTLGSRFPSMSRLTPLSTATCTGAVYDVGHGARGRPRSAGRDVPTSTRTDRSTTADDHLAHAADTGREEVVMLLRERDASVLAQPNLEWYRKEAKRLLKAARGGD